MPKRGVMAAEQIVAWQYRGPGEAFGAISRTEPITDQQHWYPLYLGDCPLGPPSEPRCSICGITESENDWGPLIAVQVKTNEGEEGEADVTQLLCADHFPAIQEALIALGFKDHNHGGIDFLEDPACPGRDHYDACPTPTEAGPTTIQPPSQ